MISEFAKEKVFWTRKMNIKLVKFIESKPNIWNPKHPKYTSVEARDQTYNEFAAKYCNEFTGQAVKDRWTNIRSTFANYLRKLSASRAKVDGEEYKVNWHLWEHCQFLLKVHRKLKSKSATDTTKEEEYNSISPTQDNEAETSSEDDKFCPSNDSNDLCKKVAENLVDLLKDVQNDAFGLDNTQNGLVGRVVAKKLSKMNSYDAARVSQKIMEILLLYDKDNPNNPNRKLDQL